MNQLPTLEEFRKEHPFDPHDDLKLTYINNTLTCKDEKCVDPNCVKRKAEGSSPVLQCVPSEKTSNGPAPCVVATAYKKYNLENI